MTPDTAIPSSTVAGRPQGPWPQAGGEATSRLQRALDRSKGRSPLAFDFRGATPDYFRIYYVNALLTVVTLGMYSAWAKVRNKRFFYGNTHLSGHNFDFDARPTAILVSRLIVLAVVAALLYSEEYFSLFVTNIGLLSLAMLLLFPFAIVRGRTFNTRHTLHRSVRFGYLRKYWPAYLLFAVYFLPGAVIFDILWTISDDPVPREITIFVPLAYLLLLGPGYFYFKHRIMVDQLKFGKLSFGFHAGIKAYYWHGFCAVLLFWLGMEIWDKLEEMLEDFRYGSDLPHVDDAVLILNGLLILAVLVATFGYFRARILPLFYSSITLSDGSRLASTIKPRTYLLKYFMVNAFALVFSLGLLLPWVRVRTWRYVTENLSVLPSENAREVLASEREEITPLAEEYADVNDLDFDFGMI